jgi:hypothetical protein
MPDPDTIVQWCGVVLVVTATVVAVAGGLLLIARAVISSLRDLGER